jgi:hypothetical protein
MGTFLIAYCIYSIALMSAPLCFVPLLVGAASATFCLYLAAAATLRRRRVQRLGCADANH